MTAAARRRYAWLLGEHDESFRGHHVRHFLGGEMRPQVVDRGVTGLEPPITLIGDRHWFVIELVTTVQPP